MCMHSFMQVCHSCRWAIGCHQPWLRILWKFEESFVRSNGRSSGIWLGMAGKNLCCRHIGYPDSNVAWIKLKCYVFKESNYSSTDDMVGNVVCTIWLNVFANMMRYPNRRALCNQQIAHFVFEEELKHLSDENEDMILRCRIFLKGSCPWIKAARLFFFSYAMASHATLST